MNEFEPLLKEDNDELALEKKEEVKTEPVIKEEKVVVEDNDTQSDFSFEKLLEQVVEEQPLIKEDAVKEEAPVVEEKTVVVEETTEPVAENQVEVPEMPKAEEKVEEPKIESTPVAESVSEPVDPAPEVKTEEVKTEPAVPEQKEEVPTQPETTPEVPSVPENPVTDSKAEEVKPEEPKVEQPPVVESVPEQPAPAVAPTPDVSVAPAPEAVPTPDNNSGESTPTENPKGKDKNTIPPEKRKTAIIITVILAVLSLYLLGRTFYGFYIGFKYYDYDSTENNENKDTDVDTSNLTDVSLDSVALNDTFSKYKVGICSSNYTMIDNLYTTERVGINKFTLDEIGTVLFSNVKNIPSCGTGKVSISKEALSALMLELFGTEAYMGELSTFPTHVYGNLSVDYDSSTSSFNVGYNNCELCTGTSDFIIANLESATSDTDYLYVYERFGYFRNTGDNNFEVYGDGLLNNPRTTFVKSDANTSFNELDTLTLYKWTFKKTENNNYHFVSIEPTN